MNVENSMMWIKKDRGEAFSKKLSTLFSLNVERKGLSRQPLFNLVVFMKENQLNSIDM